MTLVKIRRGKSFHRVGTDNIPLFDYFEIEGVNTIVTKLTHLFSLSEQQYKGWKQLK